jgi:hypothetical protein
MLYLSANQLSDSEIVMEPLLAHLQNDQRRNLLSAQLIDNHWLAIIE